MTTTLGEGKISGGALNVLGNATLTTSTVAHCLANATNGAVFGVALYTGGSAAVLLQNETSLGGNRAAPGRNAVIGRTLYAHGGSIHYAFPIAAGSWLPNAVSQPSSTPIQITTIKTHVFHTLCSRAPGMSCRS